MNSTQEFQERIGRIEGLVARLETVDPSARATAQELVQCVMDLHGAGLARVLEILEQATAASGLRESLAHDPLVSSLLILYNLHPEDLQTRVQRGLDKVRPMLRSRDVGIEGVEITGEIVRVGLSGPVTHEVIAGVREALFETAPDASEVDVKGRHAQASQGFVPLSALLNSGSKPEPALV